MLNNEEDSKSKRDRAKETEDISRKETRVEEEEIVVDPEPKKTSLLHKSPNPYISPVPFPGRLQRDKLDKSFKEIFDVSKVHVNLPLLEMIENMPTYAKFFKILHTYKQKFGLELSRVYSRQC